MYIFYIYFFNYIYLVVDYHKHLRNHKCQYLPTKFVKYHTFYFQCKIRYKIIFRGHHNLQTLKYIKLNCNNLQI